MKKTILFLLSIWLVVPACGQNMVGNPSFEEVTEITNRWSGTFSKFNRRMKKWTSPTQGSPDIFFDKNVDRMFPNRPFVEIKNYQPRTGRLMVGIKAYGCATSTLHCKEYLQIELSKPMVMGKQYYYEYWVKPVKNSIKVNKFGAAVSMERMQAFDIAGLLDVYPVSVEEEIIADDTVWNRISGVFEADDAYTHFLIGNFSPDTDIDTIKAPSLMFYAYYLVDDVLVKPLHEETKPVFKADETFTLNHVLFDFDRSTLKASSFAQLDELYDFLSNHPDTNIEINGHTDDVGTAIYNQKLSQKRAESIMDYLSKKGIDTNRMGAYGYGGTMPIVENDTEENRQLNRRVEVRIFGGEN